MQYLFTLLTFAVALNVSAQKFVCAVPEREHKSLPAALIAATPTGLLCSKVFVQVDADIVADKGLTGAKAFIEDLLVQFSTPYRDIDVELSFEVEYLNTEIYQNGVSGDLLQQFQQNKPNFDGDIALLLSYKSSGGVAWVNQACSNSQFRYGFASIRPNHIPFTQGYSWNPMVVAHEAGHLYGALHTQDCVWNNNNTAIDGCYPGGGSCQRGPIPLDGGTILSYCHLNSVGINFAKGFHPQVGDVIRTTIYNKCTDCANPGDGGDPPVVTDCTDNTLFVNVLLDAYPDETSYKITTDEGVLIFQSRAFRRSQVGDVIADTLCLQDGCYVFTIIDSTGLRNEGCLDGMYYFGDAFGEMGSGQEFRGSERKPFCFGDTPPPGDCIFTSLDEVYPFVIQNQGGVVTYENGGVTLFGNAWQFAPVDYTVTPNSILTADILITTLGEIHGFMLVDNLGSLVPANVLRLGGTQAWGRFIEGASVGEWSRVTIPIGQLIPNITYKYIVLINDKDVGTRNTKTSFRNIELCETSGLSLMDYLPQVIEGSEVATSPNAPYPNPVSDTLQIGFSTMWHLYDATGKLVSAGWGNEINMIGLNPGLYILNNGFNAYKIIKK